MAAQKFVEFKPDLRGSQLKMGLPQRQQKIEGNGRNLVFERKNERESINLNDSPFTNIKGDIMKYSPIRT